MRIITIIEDTCGLPEYKYEHGLSIYIETKKHKLLLDTGASGAFLENAKTLGIDLAKVDTLILSHGHYDHAGGIMDFVKICPDAAIYMQKNADGDYYHNVRYIGIDKRILSLPQVHKIDGDIAIDEELSLMAGIKGRKLWPKSNLSLKKRVNGADIQDEFEHEQCLVIKHNSGMILLSGCAHNGILNILDSFKERYGCLPALVISGFHMMKKSEYTDTEIEEIRKTAEELQKLETVFYTGHCTGQQAFNLMKSIMGEKLRAIHSGTEILI